MRREMFYKRLFATILCLLFFNSNVFALDAAKNLIDHTSGVNPTTNGNITNITTTHAIDTYHWSSYNLAPNEVANYIFSANGQTALNYLSPGANPSSIYGAIMSSGAAGNILLFNPNGIMMGAGASVSGANTFFASTNKFDGIVNGKVTFSEAEKNNPLTVGNIRFNNVNNAHFVAPNVSIKADNINTANSVSVRAIGGGEYDVNTNLFSKETAVKNPIANKNILDVDANIASNKITIETKADSDTYATALISGDIKANKAVTGENGEVYIIASNDNTSSNAGMQVVQNATIGGESAKVDIKAQNYTQNGDIDVSGETGGSVNITANKDYTQNANITAKGTGSKGGSVEINAGTVTSNSSTIEASGQTQGGSIDIIGDTQIVSSGTYNASSSDGSGGNIKISAPTTKLFGANIDASGYTAGGNVYIGEPKTSKKSISKNDLTIFSKDSKINASSSNGKGGNVCLYSAGDTFAYGEIDTSGIGDNGGYIELSGEKYLAINPDNIIFGKGGTLYLDPKDITISNGPDSGDAKTNYDNYTDPPLTSLVITTETIKTWLNSGFVTLAANDDITIASALTAVDVGGKTLTLNAGRSLFINANVTTGNANITILANDTSAPNRSAGIAEIKMAKGTKIDAGTGNVSITLSNKGDNGNITLEDITADKIDVYNNGLTLAHTIIGSDGSNIIINGALTAKSTDTTDINKCSNISTLFGNITQAPGSKVSTQNDLFLSAGFDETTDGNINLDQSVDCFGQVHIHHAYDAWVFGLRNLKMGNVNVGHNLTLRAFGLLFSHGDIGQCDGTTIKVGNDTKLYAPGDIKLDNDGNDFCSNVGPTDNGQVYIAGECHLTQSVTSASIKDSVGILRMGDVRDSGDLTLTATNGDITQCSTPSTSIIAGGTSGSKTTLTSTTGKIDLKNDTNDFKNPVYVDANKSATIHDKNDLQMGTVLSGGKLTLVAGAGSTGGSLTMANTTVSGGGADLTAYDNINFTDDASITGAMKATATNGNIDQTAGTLTVTGASTLSASTGTINLADTTNDFQDAVTSTSGSTTTIKDVNDLTMGTVLSGGKLTLVAGADLGSTGGSLTMANTTVSGGGADLTAFDNINFTADASITDAMTATATNGNIDQTAGKLTVTGASTLSASTGTINLADTTNDFQDAVTSTSGSTTTIKDVNDLTMGTVLSGGKLTLVAGADLGSTGGSLTMANTTVSGGGADLTAFDNINFTADASITDAMTATATNGNIDQTAGKLTVTGTSTLSAASSTGTINLAQTTNDFQGAVTSTSGSSTTIIDANNLTMGTVSAGTYLTLAAGWSGAGDLSMDKTTVGNDMELSATGGNISQNTNTGHAITVTGKSKLTALSGGTGTGNIDLSSQYNNFSGRVAANSDNDTKIGNANALIMDTSTIGHDLTLSAGGDITQDGTTTLSVVNDTHLRAANVAGTTQYDVKLGDNDNRFGTNTTGQVYIDIARDAFIKGYDGVDTLRMGTSVVKRDLTLTSAGDIMQCSPSTLTITGTTTLAAGAGKDIKLTETTNDFGGNVLISSGRNVDLYDINNLNFGASNMTGTLTAEAVQDINVNGVVNTGGTIGFAAGRGIGINSNVTASSGNIKMTGNNGLHAGSPANIAMATGTKIEATNGNIDIELVGTVQPDPGIITLSNLTGQTIFARNQSLAAGTNLVVNPGSIIKETSETDPNPLILISDGGNFINNAGATALSTIGDRRWLVYTGSPADTTLGGLLPVNTFYSSTYDTVSPTTVAPGDSVLYRTPAPSGGGGGGGGGGAAGGIVAGTVGGAAVAGGAATASGLGLLPGLLLGLASPIQFDECMLDVIDQSKDAYPLLVRNMQYVFQTCDISKLDPCKIGSTKFIPDLGINNGSYALVKVQIPAKFACAPKGVTVRITQKSCPFGISKNIPDMNFNVFNTLSDKEISSMYATRRFLKPNYLAKRIATLRTNSKIEPNNGIIQKTILVRPGETKNNLSIAVNYLKNGQFPRKNSPLKLDKQTYSLVVQFCENK